MKKPRVIKILLLLPCFAGSYAYSKDIAVTLSSGMNQLMTTVAAEVDIGGANDLSVGVGVGSKTVEGKIGLVRTQVFAKNIYGKARLNFGGGRYAVKEGDEFTYAVGEVSLGVKANLYQNIYGEVGALQRGVVGRVFDRQPAAYLSASISF